MSGSTVIHIDIAREREREIYEKKVDVKKKMYEFCKTKLTLRNTTDL